MNQESSQLLRLADEHAKALPVGITGLAKDAIESAIDHAIQAIILAAAAVESEVNMAIAQPLCFLSPVAARAYFADVFRLASRSSIRDKIEFLLRNREGLRLSKREKADLRALFEARNAIMHSTPEYKEYPATERHTRGLTREIVDACGGVLSVLQTGFRSTESFKQARHACETARLFLNALKASKPFKKAANNGVHDSLGPLAEEDDP